jgi:hypothetical protein
VKSLEFALSSISLLFHSFKSLEAGSEANLQILQECVLEIWKLVDSVAMDLFPKLLSGKPEVYQALLEAAAMGANCVSVDLSRYNYSEQVSHPNREIEVAELQCKLGHPMPLTPTGTLPSH